MFSKYVTNRGVDSSYAPIYSPRELSVHLIHHSREDTADYELSLKELLDRASCGDASSISIFEVLGRGSFILWTTRCDTTSTNSLDDALVFVQKFIERSNRRQICVAFTCHTGIPDKPSYSTLIVLSKYDKELTSSLGLPLALQHKLSSIHQTGKDAGLGRLNGSFNLNAINKSRIYIILAITTLISLIIIGFTIHYLPTNPTPKDKYHTWIKYPTPTTTGPKYQLDITASNASAWKSYMATKPNSWTLRIDDQALIPTHLLDPAEQHYQTLLQKRYPEMNTIRLKGDYVNETWLASPLRDQVPADDAFHFSHCVLVVKRYFKARDTGRHVCGRDVDGEHIRHCLDALDWWAFGDWGRGEVVPNPVRALWWRTKVCFD